MIRALVFDFDGLILDTEMPDFRAWQEIYQDHQCELPLEAWATYMGGSIGVFHPLDYLEEKAGEEIDREAILARHRKRNDELIGRETIRPGIRAYLADAQRMDLVVGIASSSPWDWVAGHLGRLGLLNEFEVVITADDVERTKPDPELFATAVQALSVAPNQAIALEDSPNGVTAAKAAGLYCVAVPNQVTRMLSLVHADLIVDSLQDYPLPLLLATVNASDLKGAIKSCW